MRLCEELRGAPQRPYFGAFLQLGRVLHDLVQVSVGFLQRVTPRCDVPVVEAPQVHAELAHELEHRPHPPLGELHGWRGIFATGGGCIPRPSLGGESERIAPVVTNGVPERHGEPQPVLHGPPEHLLAGVVVAERERILRVGAFERDHGGSVGPEHLGRVQPAGARVAHGRVDGHGLTPEQDERDEQELDGRGEQIAEVVLRTVILGAHPGNQKAPRRPSEVGPRASERVERADPRRDTR
mmetsp:Transcript_5436/g.24182  ORF Transcript_5436/g.24182 Transcript_5436/m.24182 type:complete len:240 (-) Transcript_5436:74-793(-)